MFDCQLGVVYFLVCGIIIYSVVVGDIGVCYVDCYEGDCCKVICDQGCSSGRSVCFFLVKEMGVGWCM